MAIIHPTIDLTDVTDTIGTTILTGAAGRTLSDTPYVVAVPSYLHQCDVDMDGVQVASLSYIDINGGALVTAVEQSGASITIMRDRAGSSSTIVNSAAMSEDANGDCYYAYGFPAASWAIGDIVIYRIFSAVVTRGGKTFSFPFYYGWGWITT